MFQRIASLTDEARFYAFRLSFDETVQRHAGRPQAAEFTPEQMRAWYRGWDPLPFVDERPIQPDESVDDVVQRILDNR